MTKKEKYDTIKSFCKSAGIDIPRKHYNSLLELSKVLSLDSDPVLLVTDNSCTLKVDEGQRCANILYATCKQDDGDTLTGIIMAVAAELITDGGPEAYQFFTSNIMQNLKRRAEALGIKPEEEKEPAKIKEHLHVRVPASNKPLN